jgi:hypothetical protein
MSVGPDSLFTVPGSFNNLSLSLEAMLGLLKREDIPPEEDLSLKSPF